MGSTEELMNGLFGTIEQVNERMKTVHSHPNFSGGVDFRTSNGEVVASTRPGAGGDTIVEADGEVVGHIRDNVTGGHTFDMGMGHAINSSPNIHGGMNYHDNVEGFIGYTKPTFDGMGYYSPTHEQMLTMSNDSLVGGVMITSTPAIAIPDPLADYGTALDTLDITNSVLDAGSIGESLELSEGLEFFNMIADWL
ncbi:hypothetical protein ACFSCX_23950 [Bacillus salitolerans]|uniref:Uncharacterized protein n=1 Tax=Bacillus salitolerans TaxID=1437434 RepID=A0ABW4LXL1_9BACI